MKTFKYYNDEETITALGRMTRSQREAWHTRRVAKESKVYALLDKMKKASILDNSILAKELAAVRHEAKQVQALIDLRSSSDFIKTMHGYNSTIEHFKALSAEGQAKLRAHYERGKSIDAFISHLRREEVLVDMLTVYEMRIEQLCLQHKMPAAPYFRLGRLLEACRGLTTRNIMEEHFGYSR